MKYRTAIFDLDGTLIDSLKDIADSMNRTLASFGCPEHPLDAYRYFIGDGVRMLVQRALPDEQAGDEAIDAFLAAYRIDYAANWKNATRVYDGMEELLTQLTARGVTLNVLSNKPDAITRECVDYFLPGFSFHVVAGQREGVPRKPDPAAALAIAEHVGAEPQACVFVGDTATDMQTAAAAGMFAAGVTWGFRPERELIENGAHMIARRPEALLRLFD